MFLIKNALLKQEWNWAMRELKTPAPYLAAGIAGLIACFRYGFSWPEVGALVLLALALAVAGCIDARRRMLPHTLNAFIGLSGAVLVPLALHGAWWSPLAGALAAWLGLLGLYFLTAFLTGKEALGGGDLWLVAALGAWLGLAGLPLFLLLLAVVGLVFLGFRRFRGAQMGSRFAFGPLLAVAGWFAVVFHDVYWQCIASL